MFLVQQVATYARSFLSDLKAEDWTTEFRTRLLIASLVLTVVVLSKNYFDSIWYDNWAQPANMQAIAGRTRTCPPHKSPYDSTRRTTMTDRDVCIWAWPSKGGVIILDHAEAVDLDFLGLDPLDPPAKRYDNQNDEDEFCQRLLLLGAKWWDSEARFRFVLRVDGMDDRAIQALEDETEPMPTMRERRFVSVGWPTSGGLWVAEFDTTMYGIEEDENLVPADAARLKLARTMDERCAVLRDHFNATFCESIKEYKGYTFLNSWEHKRTGEVGPLLQRTLAM